ncbi:MAG TPA: FAD-dependent oxidoreductase, partial [Steroidobacteraceae bacterium]
MRVAVVGAGIAGLVAAYRLYRDHEVTVFEASDYAGGHTHTVDIERHGRQYAIDTGFIVFNDWTYPNFIALLSELGVESQRSNMSFSLRCERSGLEYNGTSLNSLFAQRRNLLRPRFLRMLAQILRFNRCARALLIRSEASLTLAQYLERERYSSEFIEHYIVPMGKSIWSATAAAVLSFPARFFIEFFDRHGFLSVDERPVWRAIQGGSREYVKKLTAPLRLRLRTPVAGIERDALGVHVRSGRGDVGHFDYVFL